MANKIKVMIPAYHVREKTRGAYEIAGFVNQMLSLVEADIEDAIENEYPFAQTELDTDFVVPFMNNVTAQRKVYYNLAQTLVKANYTPRFLFINKKAEKQRVILYTTWKLKQEDAMDEYENQFIKSITVGKPLAPVKPLPSLMLGKTGKKNREKTNESATEFQNFLLKK